MVKVLLPYVLGIAWGHYFVVQYINLLVVVTVLSILGAGIIFLHVYPRYRYWKSSGITVCALLFLITLGYWSAVKTRPAVQSDYFAAIDADHYIGQIADEPVVRQKSIRFPLHVQSAQQAGHVTSAQGILMVTIARSDSLKISLKYGDIIAVANRIKEVPPPHNPHEFDYKAYLANKDVWFQCFLSTEQYQLLSHDGGNFLVATALRARKTLMDKFDVYLQNEKAFQVVSALIFGHRSQIDSDTLQAFTDTGTVHVLSVSGLHVGLVFGFLNFLFGWLDRRRYGKIIRSTIILLSIWSYVVLTGMAAPILRAGIMISFFLLSTLIGRKQVPLNTLAASAFFILLYAPKSLFDVGFQLSYLAIAGIVLLYPYMKQCYLPANTYLAWIVEYSYVSIAAQLFTLPVVLYYFGQFPTYFLFGNLFIALPSTAIMYVGLTLALCPFHIVNIYLGKLLDMLLAFSIAGLEWMTDLPFAVIRGIAWPPLLVVFGLLFVVGLTISLANKSKGAILVSTGLLGTMGAILCWQFIGKINYAGLNVYNVRSGLALAYIEDRRVALFSSFDSISHPTLVFHVLPDLAYYADTDAIQFIPIPDEKNRNALIHVGDQTIALVTEKWTTETPDSIDFAIWYNHNIISSYPMQKLKKGGQIIINGSHTDNLMARKIRETNTDIEAVYWLKDNFAYVWNRYQLWK
ncbi:ComEC/Rec2 family competence protein [Sphingobacterium sp. SGG-5]|uniref:ComEC/Rec2 family competence protein n=1 Tax=Sphingobacterium sp. SGG-5 TaxID=2710881 RepID=UPI0019D2950C|nr:ComEC/Rec2 family competence protein [Sphingobacterium sp. SGG-5]